ncbi:Mitochondrial Rho GTPase 2 [Vitis vinifera]|uniref:Mitochondrial Rho GTPase 2 n=1 Tax=Vitis vinifera TaxID=29760 RepID=A0A438KHL2_VITVI|nr:Mitochondrial Rho GTPase 2 [Vitis vinifera]
MCCLCLNFSPWHEAPYRDAAERTAMGALSLNGFLSEWALMTLLDPASSLANLIYIGYAGDPSSALRATRRRSNMECVVANSNYRPFSGNYTSTVDERYATNGIDELQGTRKTLILREIPEDRFKKFLSNKQSLAACDAAIFVYDSSDELSWRRATELLVEVARQGEETGFGVPCLLVAAKYDLDPFPMAAQDSAKVCQEMGIESPIPVSVKSGDLNNLFCRIIRAAEHPHLSIPETQTGRKHKQYRQLVITLSCYFRLGPPLQLLDWLLIVPMLQGRIPPVRYEIVEYLQFSSMPILPFSIINGLF